MSDQKFPVPPQDFSDAFESETLSGDSLDDGEGLPQPQHVTVDPAHEKAEFAELLQLLKQSDEEDPETRVTILSLYEFAEESFVPSEHDIPEAEASNE